MPMANWQPYREPRTFSGNEGDDVDEWLVHYDRVSKFNHWDAAAKRANIEVFLTGTALTWFENHEAKLTTWDRLVEDMKKRFGDSLAKKKLAEQTLHQRAQVAGESCMTYIEEVLKLCRIVNPAMSEEDRVGHILKGIAEDVYAFLISKESLDTVEDVIRHCQAFAALKTRRIAPKFGRLPNVTTIASVDDTQAMDLSSTIRQIVREELRRHDESVHRINTTCDCHPPCDALMRRVPVGYYAPRDDAPRRSWAPTEFHPSVNTASFDDHRVHPSRNSDNCDNHRYSFEPAETNTWSSPRGVYSRRDDEYYGEGRRAYRPHTQPTTFMQPDRIRRPQPACYWCGIPGHIARFCRRRREEQAQNSRYAASGPNHTVESHWSQFPLSANNFRTSSQRNASPATSDRSITPPAGRQRRSPSPGRRAASPSPGN